MDAYQFGLSEFTTWPASFESDVRLCRDLRIPYVEVTEAKLDRERYADQLATLAHHGIGISGVQMTVHSLYRDSLVGEPSGPDDRLALMKASIARLAPHVPPATPFIVITGAAPDGNAAAAYERARDSFADLARFARDRGVRVAFEPLNPALVGTDTSIWSLGEALDLVRDVGDADFGLCLDFWNIWQSANVEASIVRAGDRIFTVQTSDWRRPRANADRHHLGDGEIPLAALVRAVRSTGFAGAYVLEIFSSQSLPDSIWSADFRTTLERNMRAFDAIWNASRID